MKYIHSQRRVFSSSHHHFREKREGTFSILSHFYTQIFRQNYVYYLMFFSTFFSHFLLLFLLYFVPIIQSSHDNTCPIGCLCDETSQQVICEGPTIVTLPDRLPSGFDSLLYRNTSIRSIPKNSFRKMEKLSRLEFENNPHLNSIEKMAFKGMKRIKLIRFIGCRELTEIQKNTFTGIQNAAGLRIIFEMTPIRRIEPHAFKNSQNLRELKISGEELALSRYSLANINQLDFLEISGIVLIEPEIFTNSTRFHSIHLKNSHFDIPPNCFSSLTHTSLLLIEQSRIGSIAPDAFTGLATIQTIELHANQIGTIAARAFTNVENIGELKIVRNTVADFDTSEAILSPAMKTRVEENTLDCTCQLKWMTGVQEMADINFCGTSGSFRSIRSFIKSKCLVSKKMELKTNSTSHNFTVLTVLAIFCFIC